MKDPKRPFQKYFCSLEYRGFQIRHETEHYFPGSNAVPPILLFETSGIPTS